MTQPPSPRPPKSRRPRRWYVPALIGGVLLAGVAFWLRGRADAVRATETRPTAEATARVEVVQPGREGLRRLTIQPGSVHAFEWVDLHAKVSGFLKEQAVDIGAVVKAGQVLAEIDAPELHEDVKAAEAAVEQAQARTRLARAQVATAEAERHTAAAAIEQAQAGVERADAQQTLSEKALERIRGLYQSNAIDRRLLEEQQHDMEAAQAGAHEARAKLQTARAQAEAAQAKAAQAKAAVADAEATERVAESHLARSRVLAGYTRIVAPFDGIVTRRAYHPSAFIRSAADGQSEPLLRVARTDVLRVVLQVPDRDVAFLDPGDPATLTVDAQKGESFRGTVARLAGSEDPATRTMRTEIDLPNPDGRICEGMYGRVTVELEPPSGHLTVPPSCLVGPVKDGRAALYVVRDGRAVKTPVILGEEDGVAVEVRDGLGPEDLVVARPAAVPADGVPVSVQVVPARS